MKQRIAARALIVEKDQILFSKCEDRNGFFYTLPGGGIEMGELAPEALKRECLEETGYTIVVHELVLVKEFIKKIPDVEIYKDGLHQTELIFLCSINHNEIQATPKNLDVYQIGMQWLSFAEIENQRVFPTEKIASYTKSNHSEPKHIGLREDF